MVLFPVVEPIAIEPLLRIINAAASRCTLKDPAWRLCSVRSSWTTPCNVDVAISCEAWPEADAIAESFSTTADKRTIDSSTSRNLAASKSRKLPALALLESTETTMDDPEVDDEDEETVEEEEEDEDEEEDKR